MCVVGVVRWWSVCVRGEVGGVGGSCEVGFLDRVGCGLGFEMLEVAGNGLG